MAVQALRTFVNHANLLNKHGLFAVSAGTQYQQSRRGFNTRNLDRQNGAMAKISQNTVQRPEERLLKTTSKV